jgi:hypothetical protein
MTTSKEVLEKERHHWWPEAVSQFWVNEKGQIFRIDASAKVTTSAPRKIARIRGGHHITFGGSAWDTTFEHYFDRADNAFPSVVEWVESLVKGHPTGTKSDVAHACTDENLAALGECMLSLVCRSPSFRNRIWTGIKRFRPTDASKEQEKSLIAANLRQVYGQLSAGARLGDGKFLVMISHSSEFIFGDGIYNNVSPSAMYMYGARFFVPVTPKIAVLHVRPMTSYMVDPRLITRRVGDEIVQVLNETTQIYSKEYLFYRSQQPVLSEHFKKKEHLCYARGDPIDSLVSGIAGIES